jgi:hypothetical protein
MENELPMEELEKAKPITESSGNTDSDEYTSLAERLRLAHADAVTQVERDRQRPGQLPRGSMVRSAAAFWKPVCGR